MKTRWMAWAIGLLIAVLLTACGGNTTTAKSNDKWDEWNSGKPTTGMEYLATELNLEEINYPANTQDKDYLGVARFGSTCLVTFKVINDAEGHADKLETDIISRFNDANPQLYILGPVKGLGFAPEAIASFLERYEPVCRTAPR